MRPYIVTMIMRIETPQKSVENQKQFRSSLPEKCRLKIRNFTKK